MSSSSISFSVSCDPFHKFALRCLQIRQKYWNGHFYFQRFTCISATPFNTFSIYIAQLLKKAIISITDVAQYLQWERVKLYDAVIIFSYFMINEQAECNNHRTHVKKKIRATRKGSIHTNLLSDILKATSLIAQYADDCSAVCADLREISSRRGFSHPHLALVWWVCFWLRDINIGLSM